VDLVTLKSIAEDTQALAARASAESRRIVDIYQRAATGKVADSVTASVGAESAADLIKSAVASELSGANNLIEQAAAPVIQSIAAPVAASAVSALEGVAGSILGGAVSSLASAAEGAAADALSDAGSSVADAVSDAASDVADVFGEGPLVSNEVETIVTVVGAGFGGLIGWIIGGPPLGIFLACVSALQPQGKYVGKPRL
jgi:hypothetical protein